DGDLSLTQTNVILTATNVNIPWWGRLGTNAANNIPSATPFTTPRTEDITVTVPARVWTDASAWTGKVTVQAGYAAQTGITAHQESFIFDRDAYTISVTGVSPASLPFMGGTVTISVSTNAPGYTLGFTGGGNIADVTENPATTTTTVSIPTNTTNAARTINIVNHYNQTTPLYSFTQAKPPKYFFRAVDYGFQNGYFDSCPTGYHIQGTIQPADDVVELVGNSPNYTFAAVPNGTYYRVIPWDPNNYTPIDGWVGFVSVLTVSGGVLGTDAQYANGSINYGNIWKESYFSSYTIDYIVCVQNQ
ncbi:MAG: hypothetical protein LBI96_02685, partial [Odoribacteraceae bacterium]|nr:hypothetical protein [Odoribacteraceae bacterium]